MYKILFIVWLALFSSTSLAGKDTSALLSRIATTESGVAILWAEDGWDEDTQNNCGSTGVLSIDLSDDTRGGQAMLSLALSAYMSGKHVSVTTSSVESDCLPVGGYASRIIRIDIIN